MGRISALVEKYGKDAPLAEKLIERKAELEKRLKCVNEALKALRGETKP